jgi:hypothetical protein
MTVGGDVKVCEPRQESVELEPSSPTKLPVSCTRSRDGPNTAGCEHVTVALVAVTLVSEAPEQGCEKLTALPSTCCVHGRGAVQ